MFLQVTSALLLLLFLTNSIRCQDDEDLGVPPSGSGQGGDGDADLLKLLHHMAEVLSSYEARLEKMEQLLRDKDAECAASTSAMAAQIDQLSLLLKCSPPSTLEGGFIREIPTADGQKVLVFSCGEGLALEGDTVVSCSGGVWNGSLPVCQLPVLQPTAAPPVCVAPYGIENGGLLEEGEKLDFACDEGFTLEGASEIHCVDGSWDAPFPTCKRGPCNVVIKNGDVQRSEGPDGIVVAVFSCQEPLALQGSQTLTCANGTWNGSIPCCYEFKVGDEVKVKASVTEPEFGWGEITYESVGPIADIYSGVLYVDFPEQSEWMAKPSEMERVPALSCESLHKCGDPGELANGRVDFDDQVARFSCDDGFQLVGSDLVVCQRGEWSGPFPVCEELSCPPPLPIENGDFLMDLLGHSVTFTCNEGFTLEGSAVLTCDKGTWNGPFPTCFKESCELPQEVPNGSFETRQTPGGQTELAFSCEAGFSLQGSAVLTCGSGGWSSRIPCCYSFKLGDEVKVKDSVENPEFGWGSASHSSVGPITSIRSDRMFVNFKEQSGWMAKAEEMELVPKLICEHEKCTIPELEHGTVDIDEDEQRRQVAQFSCLVGFDLEGSSELVCEAGSWNDALPTCVEMSCPPPLPIENGDFLMDLLGQTVTFTCNEGFILEGNAVLTCDMGTWNTSFPTCFQVIQPPKECPSPPPIENGVLVEEDGVLRVTCEEGFKLRGPDTFSCVDGSWEAPFPDGFCEEIQPAECTLTPDDTNAISETLENPTGQTMLQFSCEGRASLQGSPVLACKETGWNASVPCCYTFKVGDQVKVKDSVENPHFNWGDASHESVGPVTEVGSDRLWVDFPEQSGWMARAEEMELVPKVNCQTLISSTTSSIPEPSSTTTTESTPAPSSGEIVDCEEPEDIPNGMVESRLDPSGEVVLRFSCEEPYSLQGREVLTCIAGTWNASFPCCYQFEIGDEVRVKASVDVPFFDWGSATPESIGPITSIDENELRVDFPEQSNWMAIAGEMELVPPLDCSTSGSGGSGLEEILDEIPPVI